MRKQLTVLVLVFAASVAFAAARPFTESQTLTRAAPAAPSEGISMAKVQGFRVSVCATAGNTLSGAGSLQAWLFNPSAALWMRNPALDLPISVSGVQCQVFPDFSVTTQDMAGTTVPRALFGSSGVTVSGGTTVDVRIDAYGVTL